MKDISINRDQFVDACSYSQNVTPSSSREERGRELPPATTWSKKKSRVKTSRHLAAERREGEIPSAAAWSEKSSMAPAQGEHVILW